MPRSGWLTKSLFFQSLSIMWERQGLQSDHLGKQKSCLGHQAIWCTGSSSGNEMWELQCPTMALLEGKRRPQRGGGFSMMSHVMLNIWPCLDSKLEIEVFKGLQHIRGLKGVDLQCKTSRGTFEVDAFEVSHFDLVYWQFWYSRCTSTNLNNHVNFNLIVIMSSEDILCLKFLNGAAGKEVKDEQRDQRNLEVLYSRVSSLLPPLR